MLDGTAANDQVGAVLVVGAGIGGMQAALDLANAGFKAFLLERQPAIGGAMAQLDKTFPTNDCAMCTLAPRLVEVGRHEDIELITLGELESIEGGPGSFTARIRKHPRYVDLEKCTGCGDCEEACPVSVINEFDSGLAERKAIYRPYAQAFPNAFAIDKRLFPPCRDACPAGVNVQGFIALLAQRRFDEALALYRQRNPFPATCGRICDHPCQVACNRGQLDEAIAIRNLHRFLADREIEAVRQGRPQTPPAESIVGGAEIPQRGAGRSVAIVGGGPAGLTCAWDLANMGYAPVVFEAIDVAGGMLRVGVPRYRLPVDVLDYEIEAISRAGVEIRLGTPVGPDLTLNDLFDQGFEAIFVAIGTHKSRELGIEGEDMDGVMHGTAFLHRVKMMQPTDITDKAVVVVGGGNAAIDSARTSLRLGARRVTILYRRSREEMPARADEIRACEEEGIEFRFLAAPTRILGVGGRVGALECVRMELGRPDASGRRRPCPVEDSKFFLEAEIVIPAIGQDVDNGVLDGLKAVQVMETVLIPVAGTDLKGVRGFTDLLSAVSAGEPVDVGEKVIVIGGGDVAIDVARTVIRLGAKDVHLACLESAVEMPANPGEIRAAEEEGLSIHHRLSPKRIVGENGRATGVEFRECLSVFDDAGRFSPVVRPGSERIMAADSVVVAIGQAVDWDLLSAADGLLETRAGLLRVDPDTLATNIKRIFAGGDVVSGPDVAVKAIVAGHRAATSIDRFLNGEDLRGDEAAAITRCPEDLAPIPAGRHERARRIAAAVLSVEDRIKDFSEVELCYTEEQAVAEALRCLHCTRCSECRECEKACGADAIEHDQAEEIVELNVGAVVVAPGFKPYDPDERPELGSARFEDVITGIQFERILSSTGPTGGHVLRPSDGKPPERIAFIQCVGSRDDEHDYCSSVCCMYATKEAIIAKEHADDDLECTVFYMDMRAFGKGFDAYYERALELGVEYVRCRPSAVEPADADGRYRIQYEGEDGVFAAEDFDLVVLSTGLEAPEDAEALAERLGIQLGPHRFASTSSLAPVASSRDGVFVCGPFAEPKDIPETVVEASAAAASAMGLLAGARGVLITERKYPEERDVRDEEPRVGVFVCHCGRNIGGVVDVPSVVEYARDLPAVAYAEENLYTCSSDTQAKIREKIAEHSLNRVVVASCTPRTHEPLFRDTLREAGLNPYLFEMANIRDQCSWVHMHEPEAATEKARDLVRMAVAKASLLEPLERRFISVNPDALVIGGGVSGMSAALNLADQGFRVHLVEKEADLGGNFRHVTTLHDNDSPQTWLGDLIDRTSAHPNVTVHTSSRLVAVEGSVGHFTSTIDRNGDVTAVEHGVAIVAIGAREFEPNEYLYGSDRRVITQREFEAKLESGEDVGKRIVMIQCVGSREEERPYCSRVCCSQAMKNALRFVEQNPSGRVTVLYRDIRTYGLYEEMYTRAREVGVQFIRYTPEAKPETEATEAGIRVRVHDPVLGQRVLLEADTVVLAPAIVPPEDAEEIAQRFKVPLTGDGFFLEAHMKLRPIDFATDGVFLCGLAHAPKGVKESIAQAMGAAARAATLLSKDVLELEATVSEVIDANCDGCAYCIEPCPYNALTLIEYVRGDQIKKTVQNNPALCKGCGVCMATCPKEGIFVRNFRPGQLGAMVDAALEVG